MQIDKKQEEIKKKLDEVAKIINEINIEVHKDRNNFKASKFMDLNEKYKKSTKQLSELFRERSILMDKWIDDLNIQLKKHIGE